jgi:ribosomal-protein-alanine N-acetyltransferase
VRPDGAPLDPLDRPQASLLIRRATADDAGSLVDLERGSFPHPWTRAQLASERRQSGALGLVAEEGDAVVGYALYRRVLDEAELLRLAVAPDRRRRRVASAVVMRGIEDLAALGCAVAFLEVRADNVAAIQFYERTGWTAAGRRPRYYPDGTDALLYRRTLRDPSTAASAPSAHPPSR